MRWRWDQGRLEYFRYENILRMAKTLYRLNGVYLNTAEDLLRLPLESDTELPFAPSHYKVWRNYARVFQCALLATKVDNRLVATDICRRLATSPELFSADAYLGFLFTRFALPFPAFDDYRTDIPSAFPFVSIAKFVLARHEQGASLQDVFSYVVGNDCTGMEPVAWYQTLAPTGRHAEGDELRQVREMLVFMGQTSYLRWFDGRLYADSSDYDAIVRALVPHPIEHSRGNPTEIFLQMACLSPDSVPAELDVVLRDRDSGDFSVREGGRAFRSHGKIERSPMVRKKFFEVHPERICDACALDTGRRYPWTDNILELHHVLPLSATLNVNGTTTSLNDLVALCPSCHKSIHAYYRRKLAEWGIDDFGSKKMAADVYRMAKQEMVL